MGGISVYAGICFTFGIAAFPCRTLPACAGVLVLVGALDDRFDISVKFATAQAAIGITVMVVGGLYLRSLGYVFGPLELVLGPFGFFLDAVCRGRLSLYHG